MHFVEQKIQALIKTKRNRKWKFQRIGLKRQIRILKVKL